MVRIAAFNNRGDRRSIHPIRFLELPFPRTGCAVHATCSVTVAPGSGSSMRRVQPTTQPPFSGLTACDRDEAGKTGAAAKIAAKPTPKVWMSVVRYMI